MNGFEKLSKLGEGAYSTVLKVRRYADGNIYALKKVKLSKLSEKEKSNALNEVRILASVKSNFVISYKEAFFDERESCLGIVMEYADKGDLYQKITENKKTALLFEEIDIWRILIQCIKGLKSLHDLKILHRDMKSANVFLFSDGSAKLGDLNVSKVARKGLGYTQTGTPYYASPEVWKDQPYDNKSDIWSLGCVLYEMITLHPPFQYKKISNKFSPDLAEIVSLLIQVDPNNRPSCDELLNNPIIRKRIDYFKAFAGDEENEDLALLKTINIPKNLLFLTDKLPQPNYDKKKNNNNTNNSLKTSANTLILSTQKQILPLNINNNENSKNSNQINNNIIKNKLNSKEKKIEIKKIEITNNIKPININLISENRKEDNVNDDNLSIKKNEEKKAISLNKDDVVKNEEQLLKKENNDIIKNKIIMNDKKEEKIKNNLNENNNIKNEKLEKEENERIEKEKKEKEEKEKEEKEKKEKEEKEKKEKEEFEKKIQEQKLLKMKLLKEQEEFERKEREYKEKLKLEKEQKLRLENEEKQKQKYLMEIKMKKELLKKQLMEKDSKKYFNYISRSIEGNNYHKNLKLDDNSSSLDKNFIIYKSQFQSKKIKLPNLKNSYELPPINHINLGINHNRIQLSNNNFDNIHNNRRYKLSSNNSINQLFKINGQKSPIRFQPFNIDKRYLNNNLGYRNNLNLYNNYNGYKLTKDVYINPNFKKKLIPIKKIF